MIATMIMMEVLPSRIGPETVPALIEATRDARGISRELAMVFQAIECSPPRGL